MRTLDEKFRVPEADNAPDLNQVEDFPLFQIYML